MTWGSSSLFVSFLCFYVAFLPLSYVVFSYFHAFVLFLVFKCLLVIFLVSRDYFVRFCRVESLFYSYEPGVELN